MGVYLRPFCCPGRRIRLDNQAMKMTKEFMKLIEDYPNIFFYYQNPSCPDISFLVIDEALTCAGDSWADNIHDYQKEFIESCISDDINEFSIS